MTERQPGYDNGAEMERRSIAQYQRAMPEALKAVDTTERVLREQGGKFTLDGCRDGKTQPIVVDKQVLQAMRGGVFGMYRELEAVGMKAMADLYVRESKEGK